MRVVFLVPRRADNGHRDRLWEYCRARWEQYFPDWPIIEGHHDADEGPFNRSAAVNRAAHAADADGRWDLGIVIDSDVMLSVSQVRAAVNVAKTEGKVTWGHRRWRGIREDMAVRIVKDKRDMGPELDRDELDLIVERTNPISWSCCIVFPRAVWDDMGGFDERFVGWGYEDMAAQSLICGLYGHERIEGDVVHLWHPRSEERIVQGQPATTATPEYHRNARLGRRYMIAARRLGYHDRHTESDAAEMERDINNLLRDDEKVAARQTPQERAAFDGWWPTLEELRDGAKQHRLGPPPQVTVVIHSGGTPENWEARREYLLRSISSLTEQVSGPIQQRVVYSDWGAPINRELAALVEPFGFYVAGPSQHVGYTANMQAMWRYLSKRALGSFVFQAEDDFLYVQPVDLETMIAALDAHPDIAQITLLRGAYYDRERDPETILGWERDKFEALGANGTTMLAHSLFWSQNPSLFRRSITAHPWPGGNSSERTFGDQLTRLGKRFALWGDGTPSLEHIGAVRAGTDY